MGITRITVVMLRERHGKNKQVFCEALSTLGEGIYNACVFNVHFWEKAIHGIVTLYPSAEGRNNVK